MNRLIKLFFILTITIMTSVIDLTSAMPMRGQQGNYNGAIDEYYAAMLAGSIKYFKMENTEHAKLCLRDVSKILVDRKAEQAPFRRFPLTCQTNPMICNNNGSPPGTNQCCMKKCVNILEDKNNCGVCGHKCNYSETCCQGRCVNPSYNPRHCGSCNNRCNKGASCSFGLCNYS
ncbi:hypothetical protein C5167_019090 [Papaver somniferum]|uniref:Stigma-specific STIG1-like protein 1 n=1 Tax=Papaver somniferum TaxID=3469 RepID=A0A4Y7IRB1_PAPSO|nr:hypothetical protein C5167_019090 [Papaver somniferum]